MIEKSRNICGGTTVVRHGDIQTTANIYNHVSKKWKNKHGKKIDGFFGEVIEFQQNSNKVPEKCVGTS